MTSPQHPTAMENLPGEVVSEIFTRLLAKQLAQMRCVSKSWNALLSDSSFIKSHLHRSVQNNDGVLLFFNYWFHFDRSPFKAGPARSLDLELPLNSKSKKGYGRIIGSVDGLICFSTGPFRDSVVYIWNPSLSAMLTLPPCSVYYSGLVYVHFRFGFDPKTDDYKVVKVTSLVKPYEMLPKVEVYSMRKGSWELITQRFPSHITMITDAVNVYTDQHDGHLHWLGYTVKELKSEIIVAFDLGEEIFSEIPLPDSVLHHQGYCILGVLDGKLCVMSRVVRDGKCEVWVMDEYGVAESWAKHHAFSQFSGDIEPYGFTSSNEFLFRHDDRFSLYNPVSAKTKTFKSMLRPISISKIVEYVDSLVWIEPANRLQI